MQKKGKRRKVGLRGKYLFCRHLEDILERNQNK